MTGAIPLPPELTGRLGFVHRLPVADPLPPGRHSLGLFDSRDAELVVPEGLPPRRPVPLWVLFHGGGGSAERILPMLEAHARAERVLLLVPQSLLPTWDLVIGGHGPDRERLSLALAAVQARFLLDPTRFVFAGHSDGGSYALSLGLANGDAVTHVIASSAGFLSVHAQVGAPRIFVSHGTRDAQIPIDRSARPHVAQLRAAGYVVESVEYDGPHAYRPDVVAQAVSFAMDRDAEGIIPSAGVGQSPTSPPE